MPILGTVSTGGGLPGVPTITSVTAGNAQAVVSFNAPSYTGKGGSVTYRAISSPGGITATSSSSPITVTGLTNGTSYTFTVQAETAYGISGQASSNSNSVSPAAPDYSLAQTFDTSGNYTIPSGITKIAVAGVGAGGGGAGGASMTSGSGGSCGPVFIYYDYTVTAGDVVNITIGAKGVGSAGSVGGGDTTAGGTTNVSLNTNTTLLVAQGGQAVNTPGFITTSNMTLLGKVDGVQGGNYATFANNGVAGNPQATVTSNIAGISSYTGGGSGGGGGGGRRSTNNNTTGNGNAPGGAGTPYGGSGGNGGNIAGAARNVGGAGNSANGPGGAGGGGGGGGATASGSAAGGNGGDGRDAQILLYTK